MVNNINSEEYVFNCGPLVEDFGVDSDYEDYFGGNHIKKTNNYSQIQSQNNMSRQSDKKSVSLSKK